MARLKTLRISALNIVAHPHPDDTYIQLFETARRRRVHAIYFGAKAGIIGTFNKEGKDAYIGTLHLFTDFDQFSNWLNLKTGDEAEQSEIESIELPEDLRPELVKVPYVFFPKRHRLFFESDQLGPSSAQRLIERIFRSSRVQRENQEISVTIVQSKEGLNELFERPDIREVTITYVRPNPDDLADVEKRLQDRLKKIGAGSKQEHYKALDGQSIKPDAEMRELGNVALSHGGVEIAARNEDGVLERRSTSETPLVIATRFDPEQTTVIDELFRLGTDFLSR